MLCSSLWISKLLVARKIDDFFWFVPEGCTAPCRHIRFAALYADSPATPFPADNRIFSGSPNMAVSHWPSSIFLPWFQAAPHGRTTVRR